MIVLLLMVNSFIVLYKATQKRALELQVVLFMDIFFSGFVRPRRVHYCIEKSERSCKRASVAAIILRPCVRASYAHDLSKFEKKNIFAIRNSC